MDLKKLSIKQNKVPLSDFIKSFEDKASEVRKAPMSTDGTKTKRTYQMSSPRPQPSFQTIQRPTTIKHQLKTGELKTKLIQQQPKVAPLNISGLLVEENQT